MLKQGEIMKWSLRSEMIRRPPAYESGALPTELRSVRPALVRTVSSAPPCQDRAGFENGACGGLRSHCLVITNDVLYRLSYTGGQKSLVGGSSGQPPSGGSAVSCGQPPSGGKAGGHAGAQFVQKATCSLKPGTSLRTYA
jgi:hypothetical protein